MPTEQPTVDRPGERPPSAAPGGDEIIAPRRDRLEVWSRALVVHLSWLGMAALALVLQFSRVFRGLYLSEAMDLAQIGRHLAAGHGFVTSLLRPVAIALHPQVPAPELAQAPLYPLLLGLVFNIAPQTDAVVAAVSAFFFVAALVLTYLFAARLFGRFAAMLAALIFALSTYALGYAVSGLHVTLWAFLLTLALYLLYTNRGSAGTSLSAGAVLGLCWLTEYMTFALIIPALIAAYALQAQRRLRHLLWFAAGLILVMVPWWVRNYRVSGDPLFTLERYTLAMFTNTHAGHALLRAADASALNLWALVTESPREMVRKAVLGLASGYRTIPPLVGLYVVGFLVIAVIRPLAAPRQQVIRNTLFLLVVFLVVIGAVHNPTAELFFVLVPLLVIFCAGYFDLLMREWVASAAWRGAAAALLVAVAAYPAVVSWLIRPAQAAPNAQSLEQVRRMLPQDAVVVTDAPWAVAWYAERAAVWLPLTPEDFEAVDRALGVDAIYFSALLQTYPASEQALMWQRIYAQRATPPGFQVGAVLPGGELLLVRRAGPRPAPHSQGAP